MSDTTGTNSETPQYDAAEEAKWNSINEAIDATPDDAPRSLNVDPKLLSVGATPSRINGAPITE